MADARGFSMEKLMEAAGNNTIRELMEMVQMDMDKIYEIDKTLHSMINDITV